LDLVGHPLERLERGPVRKPGHRLLDPLLRLRPLLLRDQEVPLPLRLLDLVVELAQRGLQLLGLLGLAPPGLLQRHTPVLVLLLPEGRLLRAVVTPLADREDRALLPVRGLLVLLFGLRLQLPLVRDRDRDLLLRTRELPPHVVYDLSEHL